MIAIELTFPVGRWHATPWSRQVNEGAVEWPPAPWRLLRALLAVWHHKCPEVPEDEMRTLIDALGSLPSYLLPPASQGHTRHYMPAERDKKTKIFDTFVTIDPSSRLIVTWPEAKFDDSLARLLGRLLSMMTYFGRAESWVEARLLDAWDGEPNAMPVNGHDVDNRFERTTLLATVPEKEFADWREDVLQTRLEHKLDEKRQKAHDKGKDPSRVKLSGKERTNLESSLPATLFDALHADTGDLRKAGWNRPPGSRWVEYVRSDKAFVSKPRRTRHARPDQRPTVARFIVQGNVIPRLTEALWIGERVRKAIMSQSRAIVRLTTKDETADAAGIFSGKEPDGSRSLKGHAHAHYLCESAADARGRISHLTVFAPSGFSEEDNRALSRFRKTWGHDGHDLQFVLLGIGQPKDFGGLDELAGQSRLLVKSTNWISRTPFVPTDHPHIRPGEAKDPKRREEAVQRELERILRKELERREWLDDHLALLDRVELLTERGTDLDGHFTRWLKFRRLRQRGGGHRGDPGGYGFQLLFREPVSGPITLGYGCHFGLGQFRAAPSNH